MTGRPPSRSLTTCSSIFVNAPLLQLANPNRTTNPSKAPWYFLGLQELLTMFHPMVAGVTIPRDDRVLVLLASANRDERQFERPDEFIIERQPNRHVSFGMGIHFCLGAPLARMEAEVALRTLLPRITAVRIAADTESAALLRPGGPKALHVHLSLVDDPSALN